MQRLITVDLLFWSLIAIKAKATAIWCVFSIKVFMHAHGLRSRTVWQSLELGACEVGVGGEKQGKIYRPEEMGWERKRIEMRVKKRKRGRQKRVEGVKS